MKNNGSKGYLISTQLSLSVRAARQLAVTTKSRPMMDEITPRWLLSFLPWVSVEAGTYRINARKKYFTERPRLIFTYDDDVPYLSGEELKKIGLFESLQNGILKQVVDSIKVETFDKGDVIANEGDSADKFYILARGEIEVSTLGSRKEKLILNQLTHGEYFGEFALMQKAKRVATATALTPVVLFTISKKKLDKILEKHPQIKMRLCDLATHGIQDEINEYGERKIALESSQEGEPIIPASYVEYEENPEELSLSSIQTRLVMHTRISDLYNDPMNQLNQQFRLTIEAMKEQQEYELINNKNFGLISKVPPLMRVKARYGTPTPDDMDELLSRVWKKPAIFVAHPKAIAAFAREATRRGVPPPTVNFYGSPFLTWRGVPLVPCDKMLVDGKMHSDVQFGKTNILLMRLGEEDQGVIGLHQPGIPDEMFSPSLSVKFNGIDNRSIANYTLSLYFSVAVLTADAIGMLEDIEVGFYHDYAE